MWVYYASVILFLGAEFTQLYAQKTGVKLNPAEYAIPIAQEQSA
jgi:membrane protein